MTPVEMKNDENVIVDGLKFVEITIKLWQLIIMMGTMVVRTYAIFSSSFREIVIILDTYPIKKLSLVRKTYVIYR